ncbi:uncharacterized protein LOC112878645 isoform X2 [Panicum hallii]|uniref:uncharacterized protein LOC112878645 isoform X2 n=1 Tax=Panicum hallii TaxID=206008 RepID=UPI000DF4CDE8|nr:uncharacterized protein LOC112878645 isoform X2 [Panicum hallii]
MIKSSEDGSSKHAGWETHSWFYIVVRISLFLWVALLNLITISTWARVIDVMDSEVISYVLTRPGRELLFTVVSLDEKYKAKVCIDVIVQRLVMRQLLEFIVCCSADLRRKQTWLPYMHCRQILQGFRRHLQHPNS